MDEMKNRTCSIKLRGSIWFFSSPSLLSLQIACVRTKKDLLQRRCNSLLAVSIGKKCVCLEKRCSEKHAHSDLGLVHRFVMAFLSDCHWLDPAWHCSYFRKNRYFQSAKGTHTHTHARTNIHVKLFARGFTNLVSVWHSILYIFNVISFAIRWDILNRTFRFCNILTARTLTCTQYRNTNTHVMYTERTLASIYIHFLIDPAFSFNQHYVKCVCQKFTRMCIVYNANLLAGLAAGIKYTMKLCRVCAHTYGKYL